MLVGIVASPCHSAFTLPNALAPTFPLVGAFLFLTRQFHDFRKQSKIFYSIIHPDVGFIVQFYNFYTCLPRRLVPAKPLAKSEAQQSVGGTSESLRFRAWDLEFPKLRLWSKSFAAHWK